MIRKPIHARVKREHQLAEGLVACFLFNEPGPGPRDLITGRKASGGFGDSGSVIRYNEPAGEFGTGLFVDGSYITWQPGGGYSIDLSAAFSFVWGGNYRTRDTGFAFFCSAFNSGRSNNIAFLSESGVLKARIGGTSYAMTASNSDTLYDGKIDLDTCVAWSAADTNVKWYINGSERFSETTSTSPANFGASPYITIGCDLDLNTAGSYDGTYGYLYVYNRKISQVIQAELRANRWAFFEDDPRRLYSFPSAVADGVPYNPHMQRAPILAQ